jgi:hypothetical protein
VFRPSWLCSAQSTGSHSSFGSCRYVHQHQCTPATSSAVKLFTGSSHHAADLPMLKQSRFFLQVTVSGAVWVLTIRTCCATRQHGRGHRYPHQWGTLVQLPQPLVTGAATCYLTGAGKAAAATAAAACTGRRRRRGGGATLRHLGHHHHHHH